MTGTFTAGSVLTAANLNTAINSLTLNAQSGAGYTLVLTDAGKLVTVSNASAQNLTIPLNSSVAYATGTVIEVLNIGAGTWTLVPTGGVTLTGSTLIPTSARVRLTKTGADTWYANVLGGGGLTYITSTTFSAAASGSINNCFTSAYANYRIVADLTSAGTPNLQWKLRASASDTSTGYVWSTKGSDSATGAVVGNWSASLSTTYFLASVLATSSYGGLVIDVFGPQLSQTTSATWQFVQPGATTYQWQGGGYQSATTQFDGFTLATSASTMTGTVRVYGYSNS